MDSVLYEPIELEYYSYIVSTYEEIANKTYERLRNKPKLTKRYLQKIEPKTIMNSLSLIFSPIRSAMLNGARRADYEQHLEKIANSRIN